MVGKIGRGPAPRGDRRDNHGEREAPADWLLDRPRGNRDSLAGCTPAEVPASVALAALVPLNLPNYAATRAKHASPSPPAELVIDDRAGDDDAHSAQAEHPDRFMVNAQIGW
jgi:hypothetical protein